jgi:glutathione synthase/RimK-type ligase-like ATP-grasp enzyme
VPPDEAAELALAAARAVGGDLVGVDLLPHGDGWVVLELNAAVDFTDDYSFPGRDIFADAADRLLSAVAGTPVRDVAGVA